MRLETSDRRRPQSLNAAAAEIAAAVFLHVSMWTVFLTMLDLQLSAPAIAAVALLPVFLYLLSRIHGFGKLMPVYVVVLPVLAFFAGFRKFLPAFQELYNYFAHAVNNVHGLTLFPTATGYPEGHLPENNFVQWAALLVAFLLAGLISYAICRKVKWLALPVSILPPLLLVVTGLKPGKAAFIFYMVSVTFYLILLATRSKGTARRLTWLNGEISAALLVFLVLLSLLLGSYERSETVEHLRQQIAQKITTYRYAPEDTSADGMPGGDLNHADSVSYDGKPVLTVETVSVPETFMSYLKGTTGDRLEDGAWKELSDKDLMADYSLVAPWVRSSAFSPNYSYGQLLDLKDAVRGLAAEEDERAARLSRMNISIHNERSTSDRVFYPYEMSGESNVLHHANDTYKGLQAEGLRGKRTLKMAVYTPMVKSDYASVTEKALLGTEWDTLQELVAGGNEAALQLYSAFSEFRETEEVYAAFAKERYAGEANVPDEYRTAVRDIARANIGSNAKLSDTVYKLRTYFARNYTYSLEADNTSGKGGDPLLTFMTDTKTGYDAHFASLAVLLLRESGIPARYAEGYYLSKELLEPFGGKTGTEEEPLRIPVPDSAAHAWVEVYRNGVGWLPVEVTPGYFETEGGETTAGTTTKEEAVQPREEPEPQDAGEDRSEDGGGSSEEDSELPEAPHRSKAGLLWLLPLALLALLAPLVWESRTRKNIEAANGAETTLLAYRYLLRVFRRFGLKPKEEDPYPLAPLLGDYETPYREALDLIYKERFSEDGLSSTERKSVCDFILELTGTPSVLRAARKTLKEEHHGK